MKLNRRGFLGLLSGGLAAVVVGLKIPKPKQQLSIPMQVKPTTYKGSTSEFLTKSWNAHMKGRGAMHAPKTGYASHELWDQFNAELLPLQRFHATGERLPNLAFKSTVLIKSTIPARGWWVEWI